MIKIRLQRHGARHAPFYRMVVAPSQARRDGKFIEVLGTYNPQAHKREEELKLKIDRIDHWLGVGAQPTDTAKSLIRQGRMSPEDWLKRSEKLAVSKLKRISKEGTAPSMTDLETNAEEKHVKEAKEEAKEEAPAEEAKEEKSVEEVDKNKQPKVKKEKIVEENSENSANEDKSGDDSSEKADNKES